MKKLDWGAATSAWLLKERQVIPQRGLYYTDADEKILDASRVLDVADASKAVFDWAVRGDVMKFPVRMAAGKTFADYEKIRHLRVHVAGEAVRTLSVVCAGVYPAAKVAELFRGLPKAKETFAEGKYAIFEVE